MAPLCGLMKIKILRKYAWKAFNCRAFQRNMQGFFLTAGGEHAKALLASPDAIHILISAAKRVLHCRMTALYFSS
ncbi:MAG: hypothetical protein CMH67_10360 [Nisaea sp.]|nr:hypothetical protein [Nisaea sp.]OUX93230.1 MAG: hypothetical protein CBB86_10355 [Candidatus Endolissoclinum sp. TMED26]|tara:strand:+ start:150 stop:374 length:225 start_codon:yes stop_codon:yes gene_type:complete